jgi:hypothetical protein
MEIGDRMAGREVRCVGCEHWVDVPERPRGGRRIRSADLVDDDDGLSGAEWAIFAALFFIVPAVNVLVSSVLYYVWRSTQPRRANQINLLGFLVFGCHVLLAILIGVIASQLR